MDFNPPVFGKLPDIDLLQIIPLFGCRAMLRRLLHGYKELTKKVREHRNCFDGKIVLSAEPFCNLIGAFS